MSGDIRTGRKVRKIMTVASAVFAVAMMLAVPFVVTVDTDADFTKDEQGYCVTFTNPTEAQMPASEKAELVWSSLIKELRIFNTEIFNDITVSDDPIKIKNAKGMKIESDSMTEISDFEVSADKITITIRAMADGTLISPYVDMMSQVFKDAAEAVKGVMGDEVSAGETLKVTGSMNVREAQQDKMTYILLDGDKCVVSKSESSVYYVKDMDLTVSFKHGSGEEKTIKLSSDFKGMYGIDQKREYETTPIEVGTKYTIKNSVSTLNLRGDTYFTADGKNYTTVNTPESLPEGHGTVSKLIDQAKINTDEVKEEIAALPAAADNLSVDKTYGGAQSAFDNVVMDAVGKDILKIALIIGAVVLGIIVLIVILVVVLIVKKKKRQ